MDNKQESTNATIHETIANENVENAAEESAAPLLPKPTNAEEVNDVNNAIPLASKTTTTTATTKKKNKAKGRNSVVVTDLDAELKKLTHRRINVAGAPKMPLNAYVRFMNDRREELRREYPNRSALEHTKMIGEEWHLLTEERKGAYMEAAAKDKALYQEQMHKFLKEHPEIVANELAKAKKVFDNKNASTPKEKATNTTNNNNSITSSNHEVVNSASKKSNVKANVNKQQQQQSTSTPDPDDIPLAQVKRTPTPPSVNSYSLQPRPFAAGEIPIYTHEFIEHNRSTENELRTLRKTKTDLEQQNAVLEQHVDNTKTGNAKLMGEVSELKEENARLTAYIKNLRQKIVSALGGIALPPVHSSGLSVDNVDKYIQHLAGMISSSTTGEQQQNNAMLLKVGDLLCKMDTTSLQKPS
ncbi:high mobility group protein 20A [Drosophila grimshawi]|uniref:GH20725 n=1 Tax=Drosophila grimshawi TaxID=7222 RepID=B4J6R0_DROGR|nr:high mobility group protein 20A [Drosophila grimshawi]EDW00963.1 GH20725 [Drosophila grimshawi]